MPRKNMKEKLTIIQEDNGFRHNVGTLNFTENNIYIHLYMFPNLRLIAPKKKNTLTINDIDPDLVDDEKEGGNARF